MSRKNRTISTTGSRVSLQDFISNSPNATRNTLGVSILQDSSVLERHGLHVSETMIAKKLTQLFWSSKPKIQPFGSRSMTTAGDDATQSRRRSSYWKLSTFDTREHL